MERRHTDGITPLLILAAVYGLAWIDLFLPQPEIALFSSAWFGLSAAKNLGRIAFVFLVMKQWLGLMAFDLGKDGQGLSGCLPKASDMANGILIAASAGLLALGFALLALLSGARNPLLYPFPGISGTALSLFLMLLSSIGIGYSEELFFRFFAPTALERTGISPSAAILGSALLFGASHGSQGFFGMIGATMLALLFSFFRARGKGLHALSLGHALYDFIILMAVV